MHYPELDKREEEWLVSKGLVPADTYDKKAEEGHKPDEQEVAVICLWCKGSGSETHLVVPDDLDPTKQARPSTIFKTKCRKCSGYGKVRIPLTALKALKLEED